MQIWNPFQMKLPTNLLQGEIMADYRFATEEIADYVSGLDNDIETYQGVIPNIVKFIAGHIEVFSPDSGIEIRYITGEGRDAEKWRGALLSKSPGKLKVNVWCITVTLSQLLPTGEGEAVNSFDKPFSLGIDYYYDYEFGTDENNSEDFFNKQVDGIEFILEQIRTCLPDGAEILSGLFKRMHKQFTNATTHVAKGDFVLRIEGL